MEDYEPEPKQKLNRAELLAKARAAKAEKAKLRRQESQNEDRIDVYEEVKPKEKKSSLRKQKPKIEETIF